MEELMQEAARDAKDSSVFSQKQKLSATTHSAVLNVVYDNLQRTIIDCVAKGTSIVLTVSDDSPQIQALPGRAVVSIPGDVQLVKLSKDICRVLMNEDVYLSPKSTTTGSPNLDTGDETERIEFQKEIVMNPQEKAPLPESTGTWNCLCTHCKATFSRLCPAFKAPVIKQVSTKTLRRREKKRNCPSALKRSQKVRCKICDRLVSNQALKYHMQSHEGIRYQCRHCPKTFQSPFSCRRHESHHTDGHHKDVKCPHCPKQFYTVTSLNVHLNVKHKRVERFFCDFCGKGWYFENQLKAHRKVHTEEKPFVCQVCQRGFRIKSALNLHMRQHDPNWAAAKKKGKGKHIKAYEAKLREAKLRAKQDEYIKGCEKAALSKGSRLGSYE